MEWKCILNELNNLLTCDHPIWAHTMGIYFIFKMAKHFISSLVLRHTCYGFCPLLTYVVVSTVYTRLSKIFEKFDIRFASNFSNIKNTWFEHIQTLNFRIRFASIWTSNISNISNIFGKLSLAIIGLFLSLFFWR